MALHGEPETARQWVLQIWDRVVRPGSDVADSLRVKLVALLETGLGTLDSAWLARIETAQLASPRDANLQYLAGMACLRRQLWGKARQLLSQASMGLLDSTLHRKAWLGLAVLAEQRQDETAAAEAYKKAAQL